MSKELETKILKKVDELIAEGKKVRIGYDSGSNLWAGIGRISIMPLDRKFWQLINKRLELEVDGVDVTDYFSQKFVRKLYQNLLSIYDQTEKKGLLEYLDGNK